MTALRFISDAVAGSVIPSPNGRISPMRLPSRKSRHRRRNARRPRYRFRPVSTEPPPTEAEKSTPPRLHCATACRRLYFGIGFVAPGLDVVAYRPMPP